MTLASLNTRIAWPGMTLQGGTPALTTLVTLNAAGDYYAYIAQAREDMVVSHVAVRYGAVVGAPTAEIRIETVGTDGLPSGTLWATNTNIVTGTLTSSSNVLSALTAAATINRSQIFAVVLKYASGTSLVVQHISSQQKMPGGLPYRIDNSSGTPAKDALNGGLAWALGSSATQFYGLPGLWPATTFTNGTFNNTSAARRGLRFQVPFTCRAPGLRHWNGASTGDFNAALFDDAGNELSSSSTGFDGDQMMNSAGSVQDLIFDNPVILLPGVWYRAALEPSSATNITMGTITLPSLNYRSAYPGGSNQHYTTFASGAWTDSATDQIPLLDILIDQLDDGAVAGGLVRHPGMAGGLNA